MSEKFSLYNVDYLLSIARFPERMYPVVYELTGRDVLYKNPGTSLRSFIVAKHLRDELIQLPSEMIGNVKDCEEFSTPEMANRVLTILLSQTDTMKQHLMYGFPGDNKQQNSLASQEYSNLSLLVERATITYDSFIGNYESFIQSLNTHQPQFSDAAKILLSPPGVQFKHAIFSLQDRLIYLSETFPPSAPQPLFA